MFVNASVNSRRGLEVAYALESLASPTKEKSCYGAVCVFLNLL